ncbi:ATP synthase F0 subunit B [Neobacillus muris]|uniref:ATP synthase F0 subunit B n=1 Tax=Neobacillus muris TaxID=2941334 RepID=UPI00203A53F4|nr:ATP synthase F0 subunit B [Neobacillus muris]
MGDITLLGLPISLGTMIYQACLFTILTFALKKFVFKKMVGILDMRKQNIENQLKLTEQNNLVAEQNLLASETILKQARMDAREMRKYSENEAKLIIQSAKEEAKHLARESAERAYPSQNLSFPQTEKYKGA